jgi:lytic murein transglycosylase
MLRRNDLAIAASIATLVGLLLLPQKAFGDGMFRRFLESTWPEAQKIGVSRTTFEHAIQGLEPDLSLPELDGFPSKKPNTAQAEFLRPAGAYLNEARMQEVAAEGRKQAVKWQAALSAIEQKYGVPGPILLAIFGRETDYGAEKETHSVLRVLATEAYAGRRKDYFREQFVWALKILEDGDVTKEDFKGSWAGAFGLTQFMPTGFRDFAVDFEGTGKRDVWHSVPDSLASTSVELTRAVDRDGTDVGWKRGLPWGYEVRKPARIDCTWAGFDRPRSFRAWLALGFARSHGKPLSKQLLDVPAYLLLPEGVNGPAFLVTTNFLALKVYNYADLYALYVGHLADLIIGEPPFETPWAEASHLTEADIFKLQHALVGQGYDVGNVDGKIGWKMRIALGEFEKRAKLPATCYPSADDMRALSQTASDAQ